MNFVTVFQPTQLNYTDATGKFPITSSKVNRYVMVVYNFDSNAILAKPMKGKTSKENVNIFLEVHQYLCKRVLKPKYH